MTSVLDESTSDGGKTSNGDSAPGRRRFLGMSPGVVLLVVAATCALGILWGAVDRNWVLVATEVPSVAALLIVWFLTRHRKARSEAMKAAGAIGLLCAVELLMITVVFDTRGLQLAVAVAGSTAAVGGIAVTVWLLRQRRRSGVAATTAPTCTLGPDDRSARELEWSDLGSVAVSTEQIEHGIASTFPLDLYSQIEDLANREYECCGSWLDSSITIAGDLVRLELTTSSIDGRALLDSMTGYGNRAELTS